MRYMNGLADKCKYLFAQFLRDADEKHTIEIYFIKTFYKLINFQRRLKQQLAKKARRALELNQRIDSELADLIQLFSTANMFKDK